MENSSFKQPIPKVMDSNRAVSYGYWTQKKDLFKTDEMYYQILPAGGCYTTVSDMANFIIANLNGGKYRGNQLLKKTTMEEMHKQHFTHNINMPGQAYGFWESFDNNQRALFHTGTSDGYASILYILPEKNIGFILCYNIAKEDFRTEFKKEFLNNFFPQANLETVMPMKDYRERAKQYEGLYWNVEKPKYTLDKLEVLMSDGLVRVTANKDGSLKFTGYYGENMGSYIETEPQIFKGVENGDIVAFNKQGYNNESYLYIKNNAFEKVKWYKNPTLYIGSAIISLLVIIISPFIWVRYYIKNKKFKGGNLEKYSSYIGLFTSIIVILFCIITAIITSKLGKYAFMFGVPLSLEITLIVPLLLCFISIFLIVVSILIWKKKLWKQFNRCFFTIYTVAIVMFIIFLQFWNLVEL